MKKLIVFITLFVLSCSSEEEELPFYLADNGVTIKAKGWVPIGTTANFNGETYTTVDLTSLKEWINTGQDFSKVVTTFVSDTTDSQFAAIFNVSGVGFVPIKGIESWDVSNFKDVQGIFYSDKPVESDLGNWDTSNFTNISAGFVLDTINPNINNWDVSNVTEMGMLFFSNNGDKYIEGMDLSGWDVSNVTNCNSFFGGITNWPESKKPNFINCNPD